MNDKHLLEIVDRLARIETKLDDAVKDVDQLRENNKWMWRGIISAVISVVVIAVKDVIL
jgi:t-SNARE complex subunit (syntaxin)